MDEEKTLSKDMTEAVMDRPTQDVNPTKSDNVFYGTPVSKEGPESPERLGGERIVREADGDSEDVRETSSVGSARDVKIVTLNSGYLVRVGCQSIAVETTETLMTRLAEYLDNPNAFESKWFNNNKRNKL